MSTRDGPFKHRADAAQVPTRASGFFVSLDADGSALPSDFYLRVGGGAATALLRVDRPAVSLAAASY